MGNYVESNLGKNEQIVKHAEKNSMKLVWAWVGGILFCWLLLIPLFKAIKATILYTNTELAITNKRLVGKAGAVSSGSLDAPLNKIQSVSVGHSFWGKIFNYGYITVSTAGSKLTFGGLKNVDAFKNQIMAQIDQFEEDRLQEQAAAMANAMASAIKQ